MTRTINQSLIAGAIALGMASTALAQEEKILNIYNWYDYIGETTIADFEAETGIKVNYDTFDSNEILEAKLLSGRSGYDIVVPGSNFLARQIKAGVFLELDRASLSGYGNLEPGLLNTLSEFDPDNAHGVPYAWGTTGIGVNFAMVEARMPGAPVDSWDMIFKPEILAKFADCGVAIIDSPGEVVPIVLHYLGKDPNSESKEDLKAAMAVLNSIRPYIKHFNTGQIIDDLANGEVCVVVDYNGDVSIAFVRAEEAGADVSLGYAIPTQGTEIFFDVMAIPDDAPHPENAHLFINFMLQPKNIAAMTNYVYYANANAKAGAFVAPEILEDPGIYPSAEVQAKLFAVKPHSLKYDRLLTRAWSNFKAGR